MAQEIAIGTKDRFSEKWKTQWLPSEFKIPKVVASMC